MRGRALRTETLARLVEDAQIGEIVLPPHLRKCGKPQDGSADSDGARIIRRGPIKVRHRFDPVWDARHEAISTYLCLPDAILCPESPGASGPISFISARPDGRRASVR